jgi:hypothetical protein
MYPFPPIGDKLVRVPKDVAADSDADIDEDATILQLFNTIHLFMDGAHENIFRTIWSTWYGD